MDALAMPALEKSNEGKAMTKHVHPKSGRRVKLQGAEPDHGKPQLDPNRGPAVQGFVVEDEDWIRLKYRYLRLKWVLGIDDDDFCVGLVYQLSEVMRYDDETNFEFVLSFLRGAKPIDNLH